MKKDMFALFQCSTFHNSQRTILQVTGWFIKVKIWVLTTSNNGFPLSECVNRLTKSRGYLFWSRIFRIISKAIKRSALGKE